MSGLLDYIPPYKRAPPPSVKHGTEVSIQRYLELSSLWNLWKSLLHEILVQICFKAISQVNGERDVKCKDLPPLVKEFAEPCTTRGWKNTVENITPHCLLLYCIYSCPLSRVLSKMDLCSDLQQYCFCAAAALSRSLEILSIQIHY